MHIYLERVMYYYAWMVVIAMFVGINCSLIGTLLLVRKQMMVGDAVAHSVFPGMVFSFLLTGLFNQVVLFLGALMGGFVSSLLILFFQNQVKINKEEGIGFVFTSLFALGLLWVSLYTDKVDLDVECVLYGQITLAPLLLLSYQGVSLGPISFWSLLGLFFFNITVLRFFYRPWLLTSFDPAYAKALGYRVDYWHYALLLVLTLNLTIVFRIVGGLLPLAFLSIPPLTLYIANKSLKGILIGSSLLVILIALLGFFLALFLNASVVGSLVVVAGMIFFLVFLVTYLQKISNLKK